jgi:hypothetical protein
MQEQVTDRPQPKCFGRPLGLGAVNLQRRGQPRRARVSDRRIGQGVRVERVGSGEGCGGHVRGLFVEQTGRMINVCADATRLTPT